VPDAYYIPLGNPVTGDLFSAVGGEIDERHRYLLDREAEEASFMVSGHAGKMERNLKTFQS
jgi:hypothetical protein